MTEKRQCDIPAALLFISLGILLLFGCVKPKTDRGALAKGPQERKPEQSESSDPQALAIARLTQSISSGRLTRKDLARAHIDRAAVYYAQQKYDLALADINKTLELAPDFTAAYANRGDCHARMDNHRQAAEDYSRYLKHHPRKAEVFFKRGVSYFHQKDYDKAVSDFSRCLKITPQYAEAYLNRCLALVQKEDYEGALKDIDRFLALKPDHEKGVRIRRYLISKMEAPETV